MEVHVNSGIEECIHTNLFREGVEACSCILVWPLSLNASSPGDKFSRSIELSIHDTFLVDKHVGCPSVSQDSSTSQNFPSLSTEVLGLLGLALVISIRGKSRPA
jgi:hypothetical protein